MSGTLYFALALTGLLSVIGFGIAYLSHRAHKRDRQ